MWPNSFCFQFFFYTKMAPPNLSLVVLSRKAAVSFLFQVCRSSSMYTTQQLVHHLEVPDRLFLLHWPSRPWPSFRWFHTAVNMHADNSGTRKEPASLCCVTLSIETCRFAIFFVSVWLNAWRKRHWLALRLWFAVDTWAIALQYFCLRFYKIMAIPNTHWLYPPSQFMYLVQLLIFCMTFH